MKYDKFDPNPPDDFHPSEVRLLVRYCNDEIGVDLTTETHLFEDNPVLQSFYNTLRASLWHRHGMGVK